MSMYRLMKGSGLVSRVLLGLTFIFSGAVKAIDPLGTVYKIEDYLKAFGGLFTDLMPAASVAAWTLICVEVLLGVCLLLNVRMQWTAWLTLAFYAVMTPLTLYVAIKNPVSDCGCFGDALVLTNWQTFWKNIILLALVIILIMFRKVIHSAFRPRVEGMIAGVTIALTLGFMAWTMNHLPVKDFRPYKIGNHLPGLMEYPENAEPDVYDIRLIYAKDGVEQEFTVNDYPRGDSSWVFVRQDSRLVKKGYEPPIHDFVITNSEYEDITDLILESETPVTLAIMYDLNKTNMKQAQRLNALYEQCVNNGELFYAVTGSGTDEIIGFALETNAEYEICSCDPVTLKTIVRANPGIIVLQNGIVTDKYNLKNR